MTVTLLDATLVVIMLISAILAMVRGFSREVLSIVSWVVAALAAFYFYPLLTPYAQEYINSETAAMAASALAIFLIALIIVSFITLRIADFIIDSRVGPLDRALGFVFGAARGLLLVVVAMLFFNWLTPENQPEWVTQASSKPFLDDLGGRLVAALPENPEETIRQQFGGPDAPATQTGEGAATIEGAIEDAEQPAEAPPAN
ncbi:CvpA family protein [Aureimonas populi]|uniref:CvpA family protein n=1 Tax=Aureimonas populi TaxID=1701758 RepID=A0ABW5CGM1_9HYPH|nr:CvpA family protein [Aureimonas populi]